MNQPTEEKQMTRRPDFLAEVESTNALQVQNIGDLMRVAEVIARSKLCPKALQNDPGSTLLVMGAAAQLGIPIFLGLQRAHVIEGKVGWAAELIEALCRRSPRYKLMYLKELADDRAVYAVQTTEMPAPVEVVYTLADAKAAGLLGRAGGAWNTSPKDMLVARCRVRAGRRYFPEALQGAIFKEDIADGVASGAFEDAGALDVDAAPAPAVERPARRKRGDNAARLDEVSSASPMPPIIDIEPVPTPVAAPQAVTPAEEPASPAEPTPSDSDGGGLFSFDGGDDEAPEPDAPFKADLTALRAAAEKIGKHGPRLVAGFVKNRYGIATEEQMAAMTEDQYLSVDSFIKESLRIQAEQGGGR